MPAARPCAAPAWSAADLGRPCRGPLRARSNSISPHTWRVQAAAGNGRGPWSANATFRAAAGGYIRDNEVFDPLTNGRTAGNLFGPTTFGPNGITLLDFSSHVTYRLPVNLQAGELSMMILGADEGSPGDKSKVFAMQEGDDENDITDDDYRFTAELRGRQYGAPGSVTYRIIAGDGVSRDGARVQLELRQQPLVLLEVHLADRLRQSPGAAGRPQRQRHLQLGDRHGKPPVSAGTALHPSGRPIGRACACDATMPGITIKNVWASSRPRPAFPGE